MLVIIRNIFSPKTVRPFKAMPEFVFTINIIYIIVSYFKLHTIILLRLKRVEDWQVNTFLCFATTSIQGLWDMLLLKGIQGKLSTSFTRLTEICIGQKWLDLTKACCKKMPYITEIKIVIYIHVILYIKMDLLW
jgi:hypothetical protein